MATNVKILKGKDESPQVLLKKFSRKMIESGVVMKAKKHRFALRDLSKLKRKKDRLVKLEAKDKYDMLKKMGKLQKPERKYTRPAESTSNTVVANANGTVAKV
jgi:ribosomal protein S21